MHTIALILFGLGALFAAWMPFAAITSGRLKWEVLAAPVLPLLAAVVAKYLSLP
jgi:hypothetical protein